MKTLPCRNEYQQLLMSALALVDEADLVAFFRAARKHPERNKCIDIVNRELDKGVSLMEVFDAPSELYELFTDDWPELRVLVDQETNTISIDFGTNGPPSDIRTLYATMGDTGVVTKLKYQGRHFLEVLPEHKGPKVWNTLTG